MEIETKTCTKCKETKPLTEFHKHTNARGKQIGYTWHDKLCRICRRTNLKAWRDANPDIVKANRNEYRNSFKGFIKSVEIDTRSRSKKKNIEHNVTEKYLLNLWNEQKGLCAISGQPLQYTREPGTRVSPYRASLDKVDPSKGYVISNVRWTCYFANLMKNDHSEQDFFHYIELIARHNKLTD